MLRAKVSFRRAARRHRSLRIEHLETRCLFSGAAGASEAAAPPAASGASPPVITIHAGNTRFNVWTFEGTVADAAHAVAGLTVQFGGVLAKYHITATVDAQGKYSVTQIVDYGTVGTASAQTRCNDGDASNVALTFVECDSPGGTTIGEGTTVVVSDGVVPDGSALRVAAGAKLVFDRTAASQSTTAGEVDLQTALLDKAFAEWSESGNDSSNGDTSPSGSWMDAGSAQSLEPSPAANGNCLPAVSAEAASPQTGTRLAEFPSQEAAETAPTQVADHQYDLPVEVLAALASQTEPSRFKDGDGIPIGAWDAYFESPS